MRRNVVLADSVALEDGEIEDNDDLDDIRRFIFHKNMAII